MSFEPSPESYGATDWSQVTEAAVSAGKDVAITAIEQGGKRKRKKKKKKGGDEGESSGSMVPILLGLGALGLLGAGGYALSRS